MILCANPVHNSKNLEHSLVHNGYTQATDANVCCEQYIRRWLTTWVVRQYDGSCDNVTCPCMDTL